MSEYLSNSPLVDMFNRAWWMLLLRGIFAVIFGVLIWTQPAISLATLIFLFAIYAVADGVMGIWTAISHRKEDDSWWAVLLWGLASIGIGVLTFIVPEAAALGFLFFIAIWAIATGLMQIVVAVRLRKEITGEWLLILLGLLSVVFGVYLVAFPGAGILALLWILAAYAVFFGILMVVLAFKAKRRFSS